MKLTDILLGRAIKQFEAGNYHFALQLCDRILIKEFDNRTALSIEAQIYALSGNLEEAITSWKINADYNQDQEAMVNLARIAEYEQMDVLFAEAMVDYKRKNYNSALLQLLTCSEVPYNQLVVNKYIVRCYKLLGNQAKAKEFSKKVQPASTYSLKKEVQNKAAQLGDKIKSTRQGISFPRIIFTKSLDSNKPTHKTVESKSKQSMKSTPKMAASKISETNAITNKKSKAIKAASRKSIQKSAMSNRKLPKPMFKIPEFHIPWKIVSMVGASAVALALVVGLSISSFSSKSKENPKINTITKSEEQNKNTTSPTSNQEEGSVKSETTRLDQNQWKTAIQKQDFNGLTKLLSQHPKETVIEEDMNIYNQAFQLMSEKGVAELYKIGFAGFQKKDYQKLVNEFEKILPFAGGNFLEQHIIYYLATSYEQLGNKDKAIQYFEQFLKQYGKEVYAPECTYRLAILYSDKDLTKAKEYAKTVQTKYSNSMFNNRTMKEIVAK